MNEEETYKERCERKAKAPDRGLSSRTTERRRVA